MQIDITCNTEDEILFENIEINSRRPLDWIAEELAHDGHAVIVGGGPSLAENVELIRWRKGLGQKIFALNGAYEYLFDAGIRADYQVILDARKCNIDFVTTDSNCTGLLASQCAPEVFEKATEYMDVMLWHPKIDGIEGHLPDQRESLTLIGGGTTVGLSAMCLAYTMGYRKLHLFGYDSSHRETGHAYAQPMNDKEPVCKVTVFGRTFKASLAMAKQAEFFPTVCDNLIDLGCVITIDGDGLLPYIAQQIASQPKLSEQEKYEAMWGFDQYRTVAPGELVADVFVELAGIEKSDVVIDFGCGTGRGAARVHELTGCEFILIDFAANSLDSDVLSQNWYTPYRHDLTQPLQLKSKHGFCTDVMEHIPSDQVDAVISNIMGSSENVFFQISLIEDNCGALIGHALHLSVHPCEWWEYKFKSLGYFVKWSQDHGESALYYVTR